MTARSRTLASAATLLAAAAAVVAYAWFGVAKKDEADQARKAAGERLFSFEPAQVKAMRVEAKGETTALSRDGEGWVIEGAAPARAQRHVVDGMVEAVARLSRKAALSPVDEAALERYGLVRPEARVTLSLGAGHEEQLAVGAENGYDGSRFVRAGGTVALVDGGIAWQLTRGRRDLEQPPPPPPAADAGVDAGRPSP